MEKKINRGTKCRLQGKQCLKKLCKLIILCIKWANVCNKLRKSSLNCEEDKHLEAMVMVIILQGELPIRKGRDVGTPIMHLKNIKCGLRLY